MPYAYPPRTRGNLASIHSEEEEEEQEQVVGTPPAETLQQPLQLPFRRTREVIHSFVYEEEIDEEGNALPDTPEEEDQDQLPPSAPEHPGAWRPWVFSSVFLLALVGTLVGIALLPFSTPLVTRTILVKALPLPLQTFTSTQVIVPSIDYWAKATNAQGTLTIYNGSNFAQQIPANFLLTSSTGVEVQTTQSVLVPAGSAPNYGVNTVAAQAVNSGASGNIAAGTIDQVYGQDLTIKNLSSFWGGKNSQHIQHITTADHEKAVRAATQSLNTQVAASQGLLAQACAQSEQQAGLKLTVNWSCQFVTYRMPDSQAILVSAHVVNGGKQIQLVVQEPRVRPLPPLILR